MQWLFGRLAMRRRRFGQRHGTGRSRLAQTAERAASSVLSRQVISDGARSAKNRRYRFGVGVATAMLLNDGLPVLSQRDYRTLDLRALVEPDFAPDPRLRDHRHLWVVDNLTGTHPRAT